MIVDTSGLLAYFDPKDARHAAVRTIMAETRPPRILSPFVLAEADYLVSECIGQHASLLLIEDVIRGAYRLEAFSPTDLAAARAIMTRYANLNVGLTDASLVVLADRFSTDEVLTLDERHFRTMRGMDGRAFRLLPADALP